MAKESIKKGVAAGRAARERLQKVRTNRRVPVTGFIDFVRGQGVVGLAVGLVLGGAVTAFVKSIVDNIVNPIIGLFIGNGSGLANKFICLKQRVDENGAVSCINRLNWGAVVSALVAFLTIAAVVYFIFKVLRLDRLDKKKD